MFDPFERAFTVHYLFYILLHNLLPDCNVTSSANLTDGVGPNLGANELGVGVGSVVPVIDGTLIPLLTPLLLSDECSVDIPPGREGGRANAGLAGVDVA